MADVANTDNGQLRSGRSVELRVAAELENLAILRTLVAAVGTFEDLDFDAVADLRLAVDESCTRLIRSAVPDSTLLLVVDPREDFGGRTNVEILNNDIDECHPIGRVAAIMRSTFAEWAGW